MQSLRYTNLLLTIIAVCLMYQCVKYEAAPLGAATKTATARATGPALVRIVGCPDVNIASVYGYSWTAKAAEYRKGSIPVSIVDPTVSVSVVNSSLDVDFPSTMNVNVMDWMAGSLNVDVDSWSAGRLKVDVDDWSYLWPIDVKAK